MDNKYPPERNNRKTTVSWPLIIICFVIPPLIPVGIVLIFVRLNNRNKSKYEQGSMGYPYSEHRRSEERNSDYTKSRAAEAKESKERRQGGGKTRFIVSLVLLFIGGVCIVDSLQSAYYAGGIGYYIDDLFLGICFIIVGALIMRSKSKGASETKLYERYANVVGTRRAVSVGDLAMAMGVSSGKAYGDLQKMVDSGYFGQTAFIDKKIGYLLLDSRAYEDIPIDAEEVKGEVPLKDINEFGSILSEIRKQNDTILDPILSEQVERLENITGKIFRAVEDDPDKRPQIQKFLDYYLPTTLKLMKSYSQLERQGERGENITTAKAKIEDIMEELVCGYERLLDRLYKEDIMDISSDIEVLETMMVKDGYSQKNTIQIDINNKAT